MEFPRVPLPMGVELYVGGTWTDISADVSDDGLTISRGRADEAATVEPGSLKMRLRNTTGKYSPRNPSSPLYGLIGRNTPVRCWVKLGSSRAFQASITQAFSTPDTAALSLAGDFDLRADLDPDTWRPTATAWVGCLKAGSYGMYIDGSGYLYCHFTTTAPVTENIKSTVPIPGAHVGRKAIRVTLDVDNGAAGHTATFYYADTIAGPWVQFGAPVTVAGTVAILDNANPLTTTTSTELGAVALYAVQVRNGIGGTVVASPTFSGAAEGTTLTDGANTWTALGAATITTRHYRFQGEIAKWPQRWGPKGSRQAVVPVEASGVTRRMLQGATPVRSVLYRGCASLGANLVGYWPFEDDVNADRVASLAPAQPARIVTPIKPAAYNSLVPSNPLATLGAGRVYCTVPGSAITGAQQVRWVTRIPAGTPNGAILLRVGTNSTFGYYDVVYTTGGNLTLNGYTNDGVLAVTTGAIAFGVDDKVIRLSLEIAQSGGNVSVTISRLEFGQTVGNFANAVTGGGATLGAPTYVYVNPAGAALGDTVFGHLTVEKAITSLFDLASQMRSWITEDADARLSRIATENGLTVGLIGGGLATAQMGYQKGGTLLDLLHQCEDTDGGVLYEPKYGSGLWYRTLESMCKQKAGASIAYTDNLLRPFEPVEDDQRTRNSVTVKREDAGSSTVTETAGTLGTTAVGVYDSSETLSLARDDDSWQQAGWRVHLGTVDEPRWPTIGVNLHDSWWRTRGDLVRDILALDIGDRLDVTNLPAWLPPFPVGAIVQGYEETITPFEYTIEFTCTPASALDTVQFDNDDRWTNDTSSLNAGITSTATAFDVKWTAGPRWTSADGAFDIVVAGERMTVTNVTGTTSPQTFTVTRGVNGYQAEHLANDAVTLYRPGYWAL